MKTIVIYLNFAGNCEEAFTFYKSAMGGDFYMLSRFNEMPPDPNHPTLPDDYKDKIMHIALSFGNDCVIMGSDQPEGFGPPRQNGNNFSISVDPGSREKTDKVFKALSEGGQITMPLADTFWGSYFGMLTDKFDITWMVSHDAPKES